MTCISCGADITHSARKTYADGACCIQCADKRDGCSDGTYANALERQEKLLKPTRKRYLKRIK
jgi:recombinational DNA repair protein (RecF pathway)